MGESAVGVANGVAGEAEQDRPVDERRHQRPWVGVWLVIGLTLVSAIVFTAGIQEPWPWSDEGATYLAVLRDWGHLSVLYGGRDAPMVPYYFLLKAWVASLQAVWPSLSILVAARLFSAAAATATVVVLYAIVARNAGRFVGALAGAALVSLAGFSRYAQEARPYAVLALAATISWLMWDRWMRPHVVVTFGGASGELQPHERPWRRPARGVGYALSLAAVAGIHTFGLFQWPAHALATLVRTDAEGKSRARRMLSLGLVMAAVAPLAAAQVVLSVMHGTGPRGAASLRAVTPWTVLRELARAISATPHLSVSAIAVILAAVGAIGSVRGNHAVFARVLLVWLCAPLVLEIAVGAVRTNLFRVRYWIAFLPPFAALMALGAVTVARALVGLRQRWIRRDRQLPAGSMVVPSLSRAAVLVAALAIAVQAAATMHTQLAIRAPEGHGEDLSQVLALVAQAREQQPGIRVLIDERSATGILGATDPALEAQNPLRHLDPSSTSVYTVATKASSVQAELSSSAPVLWVYRGEITAADAYRRMPRNLAPLGRTVVWAQPAGRCWTVLLLRAPAE